MTPDQIVQESRNAPLEEHLVLGKKQSVLMVEDIMTTGLASRECRDTIWEAGNRPVGWACLIDRTGGKAKVGVKLVALARLRFPAWEADRLFVYLEDTPAVTPGSRGQA